VKKRGFVTPTWDPEESLAKVETIDDYHKCYFQLHTLAQLALIGT